MSNYELNFFLNLKNGLRWSYLIYASLAIIAFSNTHFNFYPIEPVFSLGLGFLMSFVSFSHYLGDTRLHTCTSIIEALINKDPELIHQLNEVKANIK
jgi:hypothetical protein